MRPAKGIERYSPSAGPEMVPTARAPNPSMAILRRSCKPNALLGAGGSPLYVEGVSAPKELASSHADVYR